MAVDEVLAQDIHTSPSDQEVQVDPSIAAEEAANAHTEAATEKAAEEREERSEESQAAFDKQEAEKADSEEKAE